MCFFILIKEGVSMRVKVFKLGELVEDKLLTSKELVKYYNVIALKVRAQYLTKI